MSFQGKVTYKIWNGELSLDVPIKIQNIARRKLRMLHNSSSLQDISIPPANRLEKLHGDYLGFYSIRINS